MYLCLNCCRLDVVLPLCVPFGRATTGSRFKLDFKEKATKNRIKHESAQTAAADLLPTSQLMLAC